MSAEGGSFELPEIFSFPPFFTCVDGKRRSAAQQLAQSPPRGLAAFAALV